MCERISADVLLDFRQGRLAEAEAATIAEHVTGCDACRKTLHGLDSLLSVAASDRLEPSADADARVLESIRQAIHRPTRKPANNPRHWRWVASIAASLLLLCAASLWWLNHLAAIAGTLVDLPVGVVLHRDGREQTLKSGMSLRWEDSLTVPSGQTATVRLTGGSQAELGPETTLVFERKELVLRHGFLAIEPTRQPARPLLVRTPTARAKVRAAKTTLGADDLRTVVRVAEGVVYLLRFNDGKTAEIPAGFRSSAAETIGIEPVRSRTGTILQIVSDDSRYPQWAEFNRLVREQFSSRLWRLGFRVETRSYDELRPADLVDRPLVIVSIFERDVGAADALRRIRLATADVPVLCFEPDGFPVLGMTGPTIRVDHGFNPRGLFVVDFPNSRHPLSAGLSGENVELFHSRRGNLGWGRPGPEAVIAVQLAGQPTKAVVFGYEAGSAMIVGTAPARRVGMFLDPDQVQADSQTAWRLFEAAVEWCVQMPERKPAFS